jgi:hypothetical protein
LNYLTDECSKKYAQTDSRFRPDQRALENGEVEMAAHLKTLLEENQRVRREELA